MLSRDKEKLQPTFEIVVTNDVLCLQGLGTEAEPVLLSGNVVLHLPENADIKDITLQFRGKARFASSNDSLSFTASGSTYHICEHDWSFLEGKKTHSHTLKAGRHSFPFRLHVGSHLPSSISTPVFGGANISYKLRAVVHRPGFIHNLHATLPITIIRSLTPDSLEYQQSLEIENTWPGKLMYSILLPHKAWAAGDTLTAVAKFVPISKGVRVLSITSTISETVRLSIKNIHRTAAPEYTRPVAITKHGVVGGKLACISECHYKNRIPLVYHREDAGGRVSPVYGHDSGQESPAESSTPAELSRDGRTEADNEQSDDLVAHLDITLPSFMTPTHHMEPITVIHRVRWNILIANLDGHTSELRCSLGVNVLDNHVLPEARAASRPTRRMLLGIYGSPEESAEDTQLPSYNAHIRDRVPATDHAYSVPSGARTPSSGLQSPSLQPHSDMHLPQVPADAPLDWITSALSRYQLSNNSGRREDWSAPSSRVPSRIPSPERGSRGSGHNTPTHSQESRGIFRNPFSAIASSFSHSHRTHSQQSIPTPSQPRTPESPEVLSRRATMEVTTAQSSPPSSPHVSTRSLPSHLNEVPDYETASRGFAGGGVPPLTSMRDLPTYEEANTDSVFPDLTTPPSPNV